MRAPRITDTRWQKFRQMILLRDGGRCRYGYPGCSVEATQVDHLVPRRLGAALLDERNCFSVCHSCHREKERRERAGLEVAFLTGEAPKDAPNLSLHTRKTERNRRGLLLSGDYSRQPSRTARDRRKPSGVPS